MSRNKTIQYAIDLDTNLVISRVQSEVLIPILDFEEMNPNNNFQLTYILEKCSIYDTIGLALKWTKKIPIEIKNIHRKAWGMKLLSTQK